MAGLVLAGNIFVLQKPENFPKSMPGTFALRHQNDAIAVGMTIASSEVANGAKTSDIRLASVEYSGTTQWMDSLNFQGVYPGPDTLIPSPDGVWIVIFSGSFSPKRHSAAGRIYSTITIYLNAQDGGVMGVEMRDQQN